LRGVRDSQTRFRVTESLACLEFLNLMASARLVLTDSGGIQEETTTLGMPLRQAQGRPARRYGRTPNGR